MLSEGSLTAGPDTARARTSSVFPAGSPSVSVVRPCRVSAPGSSESDHVSPSSILHSTCDRKEMLQSHYQSPNSAFVVQELQTKDTRAISEQNQTLESPLICS